MFINNFGITIHVKWPKLCVKWKKKPFLMKVSPSSLHNHTINFGLNQIESILNQQKKLLKTKFV